jgi:hypothetical protein
LVLINEYYTRMWRNRGTVAWSDAVFSLADYMKTVPAETMFSLDWGFLDTLRLLSDGALPMRVGEDPIHRPQLTADDWKAVLDRISTPENVFIAHGKGFEYYPGLTAKMTQFAEGAGYRREDLATISDSNSRPMFEVFRFVKK